MPEPLTEAETSDRFITPAIERAGWDLHTQIRREYTFTDGRITVCGRVTGRGCDILEESLMRAKAARQQFATSISAAIDDTPTPN